MALRDESQCHSPPHPIALQSDPESQLVWFTHIPKTGISLSLSLCLSLCQNLYIYNLFVDSLCCSVGIGGRIMSYWLLSAYGLSQTLPQSRPAREFVSKKEKAFTYHYDPEHLDAYQLSFSHNRPGLGEFYFKDVIKFRETDRPVKRITMLRDVRYFNPSKINPKPTIKTPKKNYTSTRIASLSLSLLLSLSRSLLKLKTDSLNVIVMIDHVN